MENEKNVLFSIMFINGYEYYFKQGYDYTKFINDGIKSNKLNIKNGTLFLKILSKSSEITKQVNKCKEQIQKTGDIKKESQELKHYFEKIDNIFLCIATKEIFEYIEDKSKMIKRLEEELFLKQANNDYTMNLKSIKEAKINELKRKTDIEYAMFILDKFIYSINAVKELTEFYYNLFDKKSKNKNDDQRMYIFNSLNNFIMELPESKSILCVLNNNKLIPTGAYLSEIYNKLNEEDKRIEKYFEHIKKMYESNNEIDKIYYAEIYNIHSIIDLLNVSFNYLIQNKINISKCKNCGSYFIPTSKHNETLCNNVFRKRKNMQRVILRNKTAK